MNHNLLSVILKLFRRRVLKSKRDRYIEKLFKHLSHMEAYSKYTDSRVERGTPERGKWDNRGKLQFDFLLSNGLKPYHKMLDIGCGMLRGGIHFIKYLDTEHYTGTDISPKAIEFGKQFVKQEKLLYKKPRLLVNNNKDMRFQEVNGEMFDYILAHSVFSHLRPEHLEECFQFIDKIMGKNSVFFFSFYEGSDYKQTGFTNFCYPFSFFHALADKNGFDIKDVSENYVHPKGQHMASLSRLSIV